MNHTLLISVSQLQALQANGAPLMVFDCSFDLMKPDAGAQLYQDAHIPGAVYADLNTALSDKSHAVDSASGGRHPLPSRERFAAWLTRVGLRNDCQAVVYDRNGANYCGRLWWMLKWAGHDAVAVLDGGLPKWRAEGHEVEDMPPVVKDRHMTVSRQNQLVKDVTQVAHSSKLREAEIIDARPAARFRGEAPEPRPGLRPGHIPGSKNVPFGTLLIDGGVMKPPAELRAVFEAAGVDLSKPVITTCGSGVTAAVLSLALERIGHKNHALYDGSWAEWGMYDDLPVQTGS